MNTRPCENAVDKQEPDYTADFARQGGWYIVIGGGCALFELVVFQALYSLADLPIESSNIIAVVLATACNFALNRSVTFKSSSNPLRSALLYVGLFAANLIITTAAISVLTGSGMHSALAKAIMQVLVACWNFVLYRKVIFK